MPQSQHFGVIKCSKVVGGQLHPWVKPERHACLHVDKEEVTQEEQLDDMSGDDNPPRQVEAPIQRRKLNKAMEPEQQADATAESCGTDIVAIQGLNLSSNLGHHPELRYHGDNINVESSGPQCVKDRTGIEVWVDNHRQHKADNRCVHNVEAIATLL